MCRSTKTAAENNTVYTIVGNLKINFYPSVNSRKRHLDDKTAYWVDEELSSQPELLSRNCLQTLCAQRICKCYKCKRLNFRICLRVIQDHLQPTEVFFKFAAYRCSSILVCWWPNDTPRPITREEELRGSSRAKTSLVKTLQVVSQKHGLMIHQWGSTASSKSRS